MASLTALAGAAASVARASGSGSWVAPGNAAGDTALAATNATITNGGFSHWLRGTSFNFAAIPDGSTITGILARWQVLGNNNRGGDSSVRLVLNGTPIGNELAQAGSWPGSVGYRQAGGDGNLLGAGLTLAQAKDATFGLQVSASRTASQAYTAQVVRLELTIFYTPPTQNASGGARATVGVSASGAGSAAAIVAGGSSAAAAISAFGQGLGREHASGGSFANALAQASGAGTAVQPQHAVGGAQAAVSVASAGGGLAQQSQAAGGGTSATVLSAATGTGTARESAHGGATAAVGISEAGSGEAREIALAGALARISVATLSEGIARELAHGGSRSEAHAIAIGAGSAEESSSSASGGSRAAVYITSIGAGAAVERAAGGATERLVVLATGGAEPVQHEVGGALAHVRAVAFAAAHALPPRAHRPIPLTALARPREGAIGTPRTGRVRT